jgi:hypothetical protein
MITFGADAQWVPIEVLAAYQRVKADLQVRGGRLRHTLNDPQPELLPLHNLSTWPVMTGVQTLQQIDEGSLSKAYMGVVVPLTPEPISPDEIVERIRRHVLVQGVTFIVRGLAEFPAAVEPSMHREQLLRSRFFPVVDAYITFIGAEQETEWKAGLAYVNRDLVVGFYLS